MSIEILQTVTDVFEKDNSTLDEVQEQQTEETIQEEPSTETKDQQPSESQSEAPSRSELASQDGQLLQRRDSNMSEMSETPMSMASTSNTVLQFVFVNYFMSKVTTEKTEQQPMKINKIMNSWWT